MKPTKRIFFFIIFIILPPLFVFGQTVDNPTNTTSFENLAEKIAQALQAIGGAIGVIMVFIGAYKYMTASGNPEQIKTAHSLMLWAVVGLAILVIGKGWIAIFCSILTCS